MFGFEDSSPNREDDSPLYLSRTLFDALTAAVITPDPDAPVSAAPRALEISAAYKKTYRD